MKYIFILIFFIFYIFFIYKFLEASTKTKNIIIFFSVLFIVLIYFYELSLDKERINNQNIILNFDLGKEIKCGKIKVSDVNFNFSYGTRSFIGKKDSNFKGYIIPLNECFNP